MQDEWLGDLVGQLDVAAQVGQLVIARREAAVVVEAGLADADDVGLGCQRSDRLPHGFIDGGSDVRMDPSWSAGRDGVRTRAH